MYLSLEFFPCLKEKIEKLNLSLSDNDLGFRGVKHLFLKGIGDMNKL
jgi:hypothetical protein